MEVKKPVWIRVFGWLSVAGLIYSGVVVFKAESIVQSRSGSLGLLVAIVFVFLLCFVIWAVSSIIWSLRASKAEARALRGMEPYWRPGGSAQTASTPTQGTVAGMPPTTAAQPGLAATNDPNPPEQPSPEQPDPKVYTYEAPGVPICPECGERPGIFYCLEHSKFLCLQCVATHDNPDTCRYAPAFRPALRRIATGRD